MEQDKQKINKLVARRSMSRIAILVEEKIYWLIEDTKRYGTLPFAGLAKLGLLQYKCFNLWSMLACLPITIMIDL